MPAEERRLTKMGLVINTERKFIFIHIPKTGGETIGGMCMRGYQDLNLKLGVPAHLQVLYDPAVRATRDYLCGRSSEQDGVCIPLRHADR